MSFWKVLKLANDAANFLQGNIVDQTEQEKDDSSFEVYILLKYISKDCYINNYRISHHICLIKGSDEKTYYTQLQTENGDMDGIIMTEFESDYKFLEGMIYYLPIGRTKRSISEMRNYQQKSSFNGKQYDLLTRNCQHYVEDFINFLNIYDKPKCNENPVENELANLVLDKISNIKFCVNYRQMNLKPAFDVFKYTASAYENYSKKQEEK
jgi:hypothetical protein